MENKKIANENFDWTAYETDADLYGELSKEQVADKYNESVQKVLVGEVVEGVVTSINKREVVVNIGYKSDAIIPVTEFRYNPELAIGEKVEVYVDNTEDKKDSSFFRTRRLVSSRAGTVLTRLWRTTRLSRALSSAAPRAV